jgi:drug/metabolite transporter (DMT)-like permease
VSIGASPTVSRRAATGIGLIAIVLWSALATLTVMSGAVPPFELLALTFGIGGLAGVALWAVRPNARQALRQPWPVWLLGVGGLFGYHAAYFIALRHAPVVEAGLINYLWPLLIVLFSALLPGERLRWQHLVGCALALVGAGLAVTGGRGFGFDFAYLAGYAAALFAAVTWAAYSVLSRRYPAVPSDAITGFCLATAGLAALVHIMIEPTVWPANTIQWAAVIALGLGPVGLAFYVWDVGMKHGDIQVIGATAYATPLLSTALLVLSGYAALSPNLAIAALLITAGAVVAAGELLFRRTPHSKPRTGADHEPPPR